MHVTWHRSTPTRSHATFHAAIALRLNLSDREQSVLSPARIVGHRARPARSSAQAPQYPGATGRANRRGDAVP